MLLLVLWWSTSLYYIPIPKGLLTLHRMNCELEVIFRLVNEETFMGIKGFPGGTVVKNLPTNAEDTRDADSIPGWGRLPGVENSNPLQYSCLENSMDRGALRATVHGVTKSQAWLSTQHSHTYLGMKEIEEGSKELWILRLERVKKKDERYWAEGVILCEQR